MSHYSEYRKSDGVFTGHRVSGMVPSETKETLWIAGCFDTRTQRVDIDHPDSPVIPWQAPPPPVDRAMEILERIRGIESSDSYVRSQRETALGYPDAAERFRKMDEELSALRKSLAGIARA